MPAHRPSTVLAPPREQLLLESVRSVTVTFKGWLAEALPARGLGMAQFWTLSDIAEHGPVNSAHLATYRCVTPPTVSVVVEELVRSGLVERRRSENDRREVVISMTPAGRKLINELWNRVGEKMAEATRNVPQKDLETTARVLGTFSTTGRSAFLGGSA
ncbi:MAG: MarR family transcriptional regulator [Thermoplasmata archaeon]|nr:MarR family transcriptional regulator [Thermoplasmata archaeon]MCI4361673.1 MarR family transcriptional regulator [Thermoplasmata archaeon]